ncbi:topoisomerase DNA-binding C4 zinc finger domain-containing protein [Cytobacillus sp. FJAT-54145]|uniref:Topoisomerase DNA-binding C4 zinc finger domain-containing protein n=1 Tax=Cytobacillus spartinae TaxID=3299023 RepID=A0ABW6K9S8_9BACI
MAKKSWDYLNLVCGNCGSPLTIQKGEWGTFYACSEYPKCYNRFTTNLYELLLDKVYDHVLKHGHAKNFKWNVRRSRLHAVVQTVKETDQQVTLSVLNVAFAKKRA